MLEIALKNHLLKNIRLVFHMLAPKNKLILILILIMFCSLVCDWHANEDWSVG